MLTEEQKSHYKEKGFISPIPVLKKEEADRFRAKLEAVEANQGGSLGRRRETSHTYYLNGWMTSSGIPVFLTLLKI